MGTCVFALEDGHRVRLRHRLESVKIRPPANDTDPTLYGAVTAEGVSTPRSKNHIAVGTAMAVTTTPDRTPGTPTSWSAAVDALAAGRAFDSANGELKYIDEASVESHRLFIVSAGNVRDLTDTTLTYLDRCDTLPVEDPAQAWNALTVGRVHGLGRGRGRGTSHEGWTSVAQPR